MTRSEAQPICRYWQAERQSVPRRAEQVPSASCLDATPQRDGRAPDARSSHAPSRSYPASGSLLHVPARRRFWLQPFGLARVLPHGFVASPLLSRSKRRALLRALSQNRASASRVLRCYRLLREGRPGSPPQPRELVAVSLCCLYASRGAQGTPRSTALLLGRKRSILCATKYAH
jgi:hypothetical protein